MANLTLSLLQTNADSQLHILGWRSGEDDNGFVRGSSYRREGTYGFGDRCRPSEQPDDFPGYDDVGPDGTPVRSPVEKCMYDDLEENPLSTPTEDCSFIDKNS